MSVLRRVRPDKIGRMAKIVSVISGVVVNNRGPCSREVTLTRRHDQTIIARTRSDKDTGFYRFEIPDNKNSLYRVMVIAEDQTENTQISDYIIPVLKNDI